MTTNSKILIVDDDPDLRQALRLRLAPITMTQSALLTATRPLRRLTRSTPI